jgi:hypothetical protein
MSRRHITCYRVKAGTYSATFATYCRAESMQRTLEAYGRDNDCADWSVTVEQIRLPDDALTALIVRGANKGVFA